MSKKHFFGIVIILFSIVVYYTTVSTHSDEEFGEVLESFNAAGSPSIQSKNWYVRNNIHNISVEDCEGWHIDNSIGNGTGPTPTIYYYFDTDPFMTEGGYTATWNTYTKNVGNNVITGPEIKNQIKKGIECWNNAEIITNYSEVINDNATPTYTPIVNIEETATESLAHVIIYSSSTFKDKVTATHVGTEINNKTNNNHYTQCRIEFNLDLCIENMQYSIIHKLFQKLGSHEMGHILGLGDINLAGAGFEHGYPYVAHPELIMDGSEFTTDYVYTIAYQDLIGASIFRELHTQYDHYFISETIGGNTRYRCMLCNGWRNDLPEGEISHGNYGHNDGIDTHAHTSSDLAIVGRRIYTHNGTDYYHYYKKCKFCSYVELMSDDHTMTYTINGSSSHSCVCTQCGYTELLFNHTMAYESNGTSTHSYKCTGCGYAQSTTSHTMAYINNNNGSHSYKCTTCEYIQSSTTHTMTYINNNNGTHSYKCTMCGNTESTTGHTMSYVNNGNGTHSYKCIICGYMQSTTNHTLTYINNNNGTHSYKCTTCGYTQSTTNHTLSYINNNNGTHSYKCTTCGYTQSTTNHTMSYVNNGNGTHSYKCTTCGYTQSTTNHTLSYINNNNGTHSYKCTTCGYTQSTTTHILEYISNGATSHNHMCNSCGYTESTSNHSFSYTSISSEEHGRTCTNCEYTDVAAHSLVYGNYYTIAKHRVVCTTCNNTYLVAHDYVLGSNGNYYCTVCPHIFYPVK